MVGVLTTLTSVAVRLPACKFAELFGACANVVLTSSVTMSAAAWAAECTLIRFISSSPFRFFSGFSAQFHGRNSRRKSITGGGKNFDQCVSNVCLEEKPGSAAICRRASSPQAVLHRGY